jgi:hypothetical protein
LAASHISVRRPAFCLAGLCLCAVAGPADAAVRPVRMGTASNAFTSLSAAQNLVTASDALDTVVFLHYQDVNLWGGGGAESDKLRYDLSVDGGRTFTADLGPLNQIHTRPARHPNIVLANPAGNADPLAARLVWSASTLDQTPSADGHVAGVSTIAANGQPVSTENYLFAGEPATLPRGLTPGLPGEFWSCGLTNTDFNGLNDVRLYRGAVVPDTGDVGWREHLVVTPAFGYDGTRNVAAANIAFSPNGRIGWFAYVGDASSEAQSGVEAGRRPYLSRSGDGGVTWSAPVEVDLAALPLSGPHPTLGDWLAATFAGDPGGDPALPTTAYEADLAVDDRGHPHLLIGVGHLDTRNERRLDARPGHLLVDLTSDDAGATWRALRIADLNAHETRFGGASGFDPLVVGNYPQIARTEDGRRLFFSWTDTDVAIYGPTNGENVGPDLFIAGLRTSDEALTPPRNLTGDDLIFSGSVLLPTMAPTVLSAAGSYRLPIVMTELQIPNDERGPVNFHYLGNDAVIEEAAFGGGEPPPPPEPDGGLAPPDAGEPGPKPDAGEPGPKPDAAEPGPKPDAGEPAPKPDAAEPPPKADATADEKDTGGAGGSDQAPVGAAEACHTGDSDGCSASGARGGGGWAFWLGLAGVWRLRGRRRLRSTV